MKDLAARLRAIVRENRREPVVEYGEDAGARVTPGLDHDRALEGIASALGGRLVQLDSDERFTRSES